MDDVHITGSPMRFFYLAGHGKNFHVFVSVGQVPGELTIDFFEATFFQLAGEKTWLGRWLVELDRLKSVFSVYRAIRLVKQELAGESLFPQLQMQSFGG